MTSIVDKTKLNTKCIFYIIATPIGHYQDISLRAIEKLKAVDFIVCEHQKEYQRLFFHLQIPLKEFIICHKKNEMQALEICLELLKQGKSGALISDCGTPLVEDPGFHLIQALRKNHYPVQSLPGANSMLTAITLAPFKINQFYYAGFLSRQKESRSKELLRLLKRRETIILLETPYRLKNILDLFCELKIKRTIYIAYNLTMPDETLLWGTPQQVCQKKEQLNLVKGEFILIIKERKK